MSSANRSVGRINTTSLLGSVMFAVLLALLAAIDPQAVYAQPNGDEPAVNQSDDLDGDNVADTVTADPHGDSTTEAGVVTINSGADGSSVSTIEGKDGGDMFGESVAIIGPNPAGIRDLLVGAPLDGGAGRAYLFEGPFTATSALFMDADDATFELQSHFHADEPDTVSDERFGMRVAPLFDITGDGVMELRVGSEWIREASTRSVVHVFDGVTAELLLIYVPTESLDPWHPLEGDINGDSVVDQNDLDLIIKHIGMPVDDHAAFNVDLNGDEFIDAQDVLFVLDAWSDRSLYITLTAAGSHVAFGPAGEPIMTIIPKASLFPCDVECCINCEAGMEHCACPDDPVQPCPHFPCNCPCHPACGNYDPCNPMCSPAPGCGNPCRADPCAPNCPNPPPGCDDACLDDPCSPACETSPCNPDCGGDPCLPGCEGSGFNCCDTNPCDCWMGPCNEACPTAPCHSECGGGPCDPDCPSPPCHALQHCDENDETEYACVGDIRTYDALDCPSACTDECDTGAWEWQVSDETIAIILTDPPTGDSVDVAFIGPGDVAISATNECCSFQYDITVVLIDLDIDSDNNDGFESPQRDEFEDSVEQDAGIKVLIVNRNDDNDNDIPDYADASVPQERFVPLVLQLENADGLEDAELSFEYDEAPPWEITQQVVEVPDIQSSYVRYGRGNGTLRIWSIDSAGPRTEAEFIASGQLLELSEHDGETTFFVEAVNGSPVATTITISLQLPGGHTCTDTVLVLPFDSVAGFNEPEIVGFTIIRNSAVAIGTAGRDIIIGTPSNDEIAGGGGDDIIVAGFGDDRIDPGAGRDVIFASKGHNVIGPGALGDPALTSGGGETDTIVDEEDGPFTTEQVLLVYRLMYGDDDPWLDIFFNLDGVEGVVTAVEGDGVWFSESDWDHEHDWNDDDELISRYTIQLEFDLGSPVIAATHLRQQLLDIAASFGMRHKFEEALQGIAWEKAVMQDDFDEEVDDYLELRALAFQNAASATATIADLYVRSIGIVSEGADIVITIGELADGDIGLVEASLAAAPFLSRPMVDAGKRALVTADTSGVLYRRGDDVSGLDRRAIQGGDSGQYGVGLIPRKDFAIGRIFEGRSVNGKSSLLVGTPQSTPNPQHAATVETIARGRFSDPAAEYTVMNRSLKTATGRTDLGVVSSWRPDVIVVNRNGTVDLYEVKSPSDPNPGLIVDKLRSMRDALPSHNRGTVVLVDTDGTPLFSE